MTNEELISKYYDGNMQALYDLYEQNVGFIQSVAAAVAKDYKNYLRFSDTFEDLVQVGSLTFFEKLKAKKYDARKGSLLTYLTPQLRYAMQEFIENFSSPAGLSHSDFSKIQRCRKLHNEGMSNSDISILIESKRGSRKAKLHCVGRDIENQEINVVFENSRWKVSDDIKNVKPDYFSFAVHDFMVTQKTFKGSATQLAEKLSALLYKEVFSNRVKKDLIQHAYDLQDYGVAFESKRSNGQRIIILNYDPKSDSSDGRNLMAEVCENADPAVPVENSETLENPLNTLLAIGKSEVDAERSAVTVCNPTDPVDIVTDTDDNAKVYEVKLMSLDEVLHMSANKIRSQLANKGIEIPPFETQRKAT